MNLWENIVKGEEERENREKRYIGTKTKISQVKKSFATCVK